MRNVIIDIIQEGWIKNLSVSEVIHNIMRETGLHQKYAQEQFCNLVFVCKP